MWNLQVILIQILYFFFVFCGPSIDWFYFGFNSNLFVTPFLGLCSKTCQKPRWFVESYDLGMLHTWKKSCKYLKMLNILPIYFGQGNGVLYSRQVDPLPRLHIEPPKRFDPSASNRCSVMGWRLLAIAVARQNSCHCA